MKRLFNLLLFIVLFGNSIAQNRVSVFEITNYIGLEDKENNFSVNHALKVAGVPFSTYSSFEQSINNPVIIIPSTIEVGIFPQTLIDSLKNYVSNGGILILSQLKENQLFNLSGVSSYSYSTNKKMIIGDLDKLNDESYLLDKTEEVNLKICDTSFVTGFGTRGYVNLTASSLAIFDDSSSAILKNQFGDGFVYLFGLSWKDVILRNQVSKDYKAARSYSNGFEIGSDFYFFLLRGVFEKYIPFAVSKHTSVSNSNSSLIITHDVDATSAIADIMTDFSSYEYENNIRSTYFVTTHYKHDSIAKDFWTGYGDQIISVKNKKHEIASHSVSHVPDFDNSTIVQLGDCDEVEHSNYHPFYNGSISTDVSVCGEVSVSKQLLKEAANVDVKSFRAGYLAYNKNLLEGLESMNYSFNSSNSANNVLTSFPYQGHLTLSMTSDTSSILEIPNTISDVFMEDRISEDNYMDKVAIWKSVQLKNSFNHSPTVLLIHPNRLWKIVAEQSLIRGLSANTAIIPFEEYGIYWKDRVSTDFDFDISSDSNMIIQLNITEEKLNKSLSFSLKNGLALKNIQVLDAEGKIIHHSEQKLHDNDKLVYFSEIGFDHSIFTYDETSKLINYSVFPNPSNSIFNFKFSLINDANVSIQLYDELGNVVEEIMNQVIELGNHSISNMKKLNQGMYFYKISVDDQHYFGKVIVN